MTSLRIPRFLDRVAGGDETLIPAPRGEIYHCHCKYHTQRLSCKDYISIHPSHLNKMSSNRQTGRVKWYNDEQGFGFITNEFGGELVVRRKSLQTKGSSSPCSLKEGMKVSFEPAHHGPRAICAEDVRPEE
ncbi:hypothetical protein BJX61DRAFT_546172 [Aspergillus egyptiacus]|nr:hypothetical protein BJX61DRAFT_546172 [Aspergillus egyptiacus]